MLLRFDRLPTLYFFHPIKEIFKSQIPNIPILMYHEISDKKENSYLPYYQTSTSPQRFLEQMNFLHENGYSVIDLTEVPPLLGSMDRFLKKYAVLTFDDGYSDFFSQAYPILNRFGFKATVFLPTGIILESSSEARIHEYMSWEEIAELRSHGIAFGSHTVTHAWMRDLKYVEMEYEIKKSKETIEQKINQGVTAFSLPFAFPEGDNHFKKKLRGLLLESGYQIGVSTMIGCANKKDDIYFLKRLPVNTFDDLPLFRAKLEGGYDWLHPIQFASKILGMKPFSGRG